jgi:hypothetical protein
MLTMLLVFSTQAEIQSWLQNLWTLAFKGVAEESF